MEDFLLHEGRPPARVAAPSSPAAVTLGRLRDAYFAARQRKLEATTLDGVRLHFAHLVRLLVADRRSPPPPAPTCRGT